MHKKIVFVSLLFSGTMVLGTMNVNAATTADKTATFELKTNPDGTLDVEADNLNFGSKNLSAEDVIAQATTNSKITVSEYSGERPGWKLTVKMDKFKHKDDSSEAKGIQLFYPNVTPTTVTGGTAQSNPPAVAGTQAAFEGTGQGVIVSDDNQPVTLATAGVGKGFGIWDLSYNESDNTLVQIKIPTGNKKGTYTSDLTYTVVEGP